MIYKSKLNTTIPEPVSLFADDGFQSIEIGVTHIGGVASVVLSHPDGALVLSPWQAAQLANVLFNMAFGAEHGVAPTLPQKEANQQPSDGTGATTLKLGDTMRTVDISKPDPAIDRANHQAQKRWDAEEDAMIRNGLAADIRGSLHKYGWSVPNYEALVAQSSTKLRDILEDIGFEEREWTPPDSLKHLFCRLPGFIFPEDTPSFAEQAADITREEKQAIGAAIWQKPESEHWMWRWDGTAERRRRVWKTTWSGDQFDLLDGHQFDKFVEQVRAKGGRVEAAIDEGD